MQVWKCSGFAWKGGKFHEQRITSVEPVTLKISEKYEIINIGTKVTVAGEFR